MNNKIRNVLAIALIAGFSIGFAVGGSYLIYMQNAGTPAKAKVTHCSQSRRSEVCYGVWSAEGSIISGVLENVSSADIGKMIDVVAMGNRAVRPGIRLPIILYSLSVVIGFLGCRWWKKEAKRS